MLILGGLLSFGSASAQFPATPSAEAMDAASLIATACVKSATGSASIECLGTGAEEIVDPLEDEHGQVGAQSVAFSAVAPEAIVWFGSRRTVPIPTPFIDSATARGPPSG